jgi:hypothetical protein
MFSLSVCNVRRIYKFGFRKFPFIDIRVSIYERIFRIMISNNVF